jgi:hypothetical protein
MSTYVYVDGEADAFRQGQGQGRKPVQRRTVDYTATTVRHIEVRYRSYSRLRSARATIPHVCTTCPRRGVGTRDGVPVVDHTLNRVRNDLPSSAN